MTLLYVCHVLLPNEWETLTHRKFYQKNFFFFKSGSYKKIFMFENDDEEKVQFIIGPIYQTSSSCKNFSVN